MKKPEFIMAIDSRGLNSYAEKVFTKTGDFRNFSQILHELTPYITLRQRNWLDFAEQRDVENGPVGDTGYRQILPYMFIVNEDQKVLTYVRESVDEKRLEKQASVGFGGHVDLADVFVNENDSTIDIENTIYSSIERELDEELGIDLDISDNVVEFGILAASATEVDCLHIAFTHIVRVDVPEEEFQLEEGLRSLGFLDPSEILRMHSDGEIELESWSQTLLREYIDVHG
jgi:predicted NUDIX family phosphoesterase